MKIFNSASKRLEEFKTNVPSKVSMYVCGITPYDTTHLGHAFTYVFFDVLQRYLKFKGYEVSYIQNVTDIDDDILKRAKKVKKNWQELGKYWTDRFLEDMKSLNVQPPNHFVKATQSIPTMIKIITFLLKKKIAYNSEGNIYFDIKKFPQYGKLSGCTQRQMKILLKERGGNPDDNLKKNPLDFLLWQKSHKGEPAWKSPWSAGRPGWHIECSAMIYDFLGEQIDIHGGGRDLIYPHHESEIAQSESFTGKKFVNFWIHNCMVLYQGEKMAKSLGNLVMVKDLLKNHTPNTIRYLLLSHHYRAPWEFSLDNLKKISSEVNIIENAVKRKGKNIHSHSKPLLKKLGKIMDQDLNTPEALKYLLTLAKHGDFIEVKTIYQLLGFNID